MPKLQIFINELPLKRNLVSDAFTREDRLYTLVFTAAVLYTLHSNRTQRRKPSSPSASQALNLF